MVTLSSAPSGFLPGPTSGTKSGLGEDLKGLVKSWWIQRENRSVGLTVYRGGLTLSISIHSSTASFLGYFFSAESG